MWTNIGSYIGEIIAAVIASGITALAAYLFTQFKKRRSAGKDKEKLVKTIEECGFEQIYPRGKNVETVEQAICEANELCLITISGRGFTEDFWEKIKDRLIKYPTFKMRIIWCDPNSEFISDLELIEGRDKNYFEHRNDGTRSALRSIEKIVSPNKMNDSEHFYSFQCFNTEFRNSYIIVKKRNQAQDIFCAWCSLSMPTVNDERLRIATNSPMFEFNAEISKLTYDHFNHLWRQCEERKTTV